MLQVYTFLEQLSPSYMENRYANHYHNPGREDKLLMVAEKLHEVFQEQDNYPDTGKVEDMTVLVRS